MVEFCEFIGLSERMGRYALQRLRDEAADRGLKFRTVFKREHGRKGAWRVLVTEERRLAYDEEPLFRDRLDRSRHLRPKLTEEEIFMADGGHRIASEGREGIEGCVHSGHAAGASEGNTEAGSPCNAMERGFPKETQQKNKHTDTGDSGEGSRRWSRWRHREMSPIGRRRLRAKAGAITRRLSALWWDNCKVEEPIGAARQGMAGFVFRHLVDGRTEAAIEMAIDMALHRLHGTATDRGERFGIASTLARAESILAKDERSREERIQAFYRERERAWREYCEERKLYAESKESGHNIGINGHQSLVLQGPSN